MRWVLLLQKTLAIGRIGHDLPIFALALELFHVRFVKTDDILYPGLDRVFAGDTDRLGVDVAAPNIIR